MLASGSRAATKAYSSSDPGAALTTGQKQVKFLRLQSVQLSPTMAHVGIMKQFTTIFILVLLSPITFSAQLASPNATGISMGHLHYHVRDVAAVKKFWMALGAIPTRLAGTEVMKFPDVMVFLTEAESSGGTEGSVVNHVAFRVRSLANLRAAGMNVQLLAQFPGVGSVTSPDGERIELFDDSSENVKFMIDDGHADVTADRHNHPIPVPIIAHHIHLYLPEGQEADAKTWYVRMFGGTPGTRWHYSAVDLPGINMNFSSSRAAAAPTTGRRLDHIGFEVKNLEAFCKQLEASGVKFDMPYAKHPTGVATAMLTDPWGTSIELTEGLNRL
jgi:uncharacterized glyoxalase superfamily protein PhnB